MSMMEIIATKYREDRGEFYMVKEVNNPQGDGTLLYLVIMPEDTLEWRAAEYQIRPDATDTLMDVALYEHHLDDPQYHPAQMLLTAQTIDDARELHLTRCMAAKTKHRPQGPNKWKNKGQRRTRLGQAHEQLLAEWEPHLTPDALECVRDLHVMEPEVVAEKMQMVRKQRETFAMRAQAPVRRGSRRFSAEERIRRLRSVEDTSQMGATREQ